MTNNPTTTTPPPPAYDAVAAISNPNTKTTPDDVGLDDDNDAKNHHRRGDTADYGDDSLSSLTTRELHRIAIPNGDRLGEGLPVDSKSAGGGAGGGNLDINNEGGLSEAEEKDAKIARCEVRNPKKIGQGTKNMMRL